MTNGSIARAVIGSGLALSITLAMAAGAPMSAFAQSKDVLAAADRLVAAQDFSAMIKDMSTRVSASLPEGQRQKFMSEMTNDAFMTRFKQQMRQSMAKHLSLEELNALAEFYSKPIAKSAMAKTGKYMAEVVPFIQQEMTSTAQKMQPKK